MYIIIHVCMCVKSRERGREGRKEGEREEKGELSQIRREKEGGEIGGKVRRKEGMEGRGREEMGEVCADICEMDIWPGKYHHAVIEEIVQF